MLAVVEVGIRFACAIGARLLLCAALGGTAVAAAQAVRVAVDSQNAPFMYARGAVADGLYPRLIRMAFEQMGMPVTVEAVPWSRALQQIEQADSGVGGIYKNSDRLQKYDFSAPIFIERLVLYTRRDRGLQFKGVPDLAGLRVGVIRGWSYGDDFDQARRDGQLQAEEVSGDAQNFSKLESGRLDAVLAVEEAGNAQLATGDFPSVQALPVPVAVNPTHLAFHKSARQRALLDRFDRALATLRNNGAHERLVVQALRP